MGERLERAPGLTVQTVAAPAGPGEQPSARPAGVSRGASRFFRRHPWASLTALLTAPLLAPVAACLAYAGMIAVTALFFLRYVRAQRAFIVPEHPWRDFVLISAFEWAAVACVAAWGIWRLRDPAPLELLTLGFAAALVVRYLLRKELMHDIRGLRRELRREDLG